MAQNYLQDNGTFTPITASPGLTITPPANTLSPGLTVNQSGPNSGSTLGPWSYNLISVTENNNTLTDGGVLLDAFGILNVNSAAFRVNNTVTATGSSPRYGGIFAVNFTGTGGVAQPVGVMGSVYSNTSSGSMWGVIGHASLGASGSSGFITALTAEVGASTGSTVGTRAGLMVFTEGPVQGSTLDSAIILAVEAISGSPAGFKNVISLGKSFSGGSSPLDTTANFFSSDSALTIANFANLSNVTITGNILSFPNLTINGTGGAFFGGNTAPSAQGLIVSGPSMGGLNLSPGANGTGGFNYVQAATSDVNNTFSFIVAEAANTGTFFGQTIGNWAMMRAAGANNQGLVIGTAGNLPLILGTNNSNRVEIFGSGGVSIGTTTDPGIGSLQLNAQIFMPNITTSSAAQTGTVCWTTGTGKFTVDTTVGCLTSLLAAKNVMARLSPEEALRIVNKLSPFAFRYRKGWGDSGQYEQFGFGAEEVAEVDERLVGRDPEGKLQGVRYQELTAVLASAIQELKADNDNLKSEVKHLKNGKM